MKKHLHALTLLCGLLSLGGSAFAHGDEDHAASAAAAGGRQRSGAGHSHAGVDAIGVAGQASKANRTVNVDMTDQMRFNPSSLTVKQGETIRFVVKNSGKVKHEIVLGTEKELKEHYELMKKFPEMEHSEPNMVTVQPGKTGEVLWQFSKAGKVDFACLQPGHYDAGMKGAVLVAAKGAAVSSEGVGQGGGPKTEMQASGSAAAMTDGEVRKVDKEAKKITLKHGEIKNLEMPGMTMVFQVKDPAMLDAVKPGDKVKFKAEKAGGAVVVTEIQVAK
jgi:uncharacterized cupredoxin-like copper-binding protein/Cu/Ag efflux protein CusF